MIPSWAKVGAKVVCIKGPNRTPLFFEKHPEIGEIYTIRDVEEDASIILHEIRNPPLPYGNGYGEVSFRISRFRPLITLEDDMKLFEHLKNPTLVDKLDLLAERMNELAAD